MKSLPWIVAGIGIGFAAYVIFSPPFQKYSTGSNEVEDAARDAFSWGTKKQISGAGRNAVGKVKEGIARVTGSENLAYEGVLDQAAGIGKDIAGGVAQAVGETIHDLNR